MEVVVVGAGLMGSQIAAEYALGGHRVRCYARAPETTRARVEQAFATVLQLGLRSEDVTMRAAAEVTVTDALDSIERCDLVVEPVPEDLALKGEALGPIAARFPDAVIASHTSSPPRGEAARPWAAPRHPVGRPDCSPPLLMPLVEVIAGAESRPEAVELARAAVASCGK